MREAFFRKRDQHDKIDMVLADKILRLQALVNYGRKRTPPRKPRFTSTGEFANWRKGPKPQSLLDLEQKEQEEYEAAQKAAGMGPEEGDDHS